MRRAVSLTANTAESYLHGLLELYWMISPFQPFAVKSSYHDSPRLKIRWVLLRNHYFSSQPHVRTTRQRGITPTRYGSIELSHHLSSSATYRSIKSSIAVRAQQQNTEKGHWLIQWTNSSMPFNSSIGQYQTTKMPIKVKYGLIPISFSAYLAISGIYWNSVKSQNIAKIMSKFSHNPTIS